MWVVVVGNPVDGVNIYGPFEDYHDALTYASEDDDNHSWVVEVYEP